MGKRSTFERLPRDFYVTPKEAVGPLLPHLPDDLSYWEPCAGEGSLTRHIPGCVMASDIAPQAPDINAWDAFEVEAPVVHLMGAEHIITNPPWTRTVLHPMIEHFRKIAPTWLLFDADWAHTKQSAPFMPYCQKIVSIGRVKWIADSKMTGKDNCAWHLFTRDPGPTVFVGRHA